MERESSRPRGRRKLNKAQLIDILERNVALYKDENNFVQYLVDLTVYLMEFEYDWAQTGSPPAGITTTGHDASLVTPSPDENLNGKKMTSRMLFASSSTSQRTCPYCGCLVGEASVCPSCRNITK